MFIQTIPYISLINSKSYNSLSHIAFRISEENIVEMCETAFKSQNFRSCEYSQVSLWNKYMMQNAKHETNTAKDDKGLNAPHVRK